MSNQTNEAEFLPWTGMTLKEARSRLSGYHFAKEMLSDGERDILYIAEALLRKIDEDAETAKVKAELESRDVYNCGFCGHPAGSIGKYTRCEICGNEDDWKLAF